MKKNLWIKVASVVLAVGMWMFVISRGQTEISMEVPVVFRNVPPGIQIAGQNSRSVTVGIKGHERFIRNLNPGDVQVLMNMEGLKKGIHPYRINRPNVKIPAGLKLISVSPSSINVHAEETMKKTVPIRAVVTGLPLDGYKETTVEVVPKEVLVEGVINEVRRLRRLDTEPVDISAASETVVSEVRINKPAPSIKTEVEWVTVRVVIVKEKR